MGSPKTTLPIAALISTLIYAGTVLFWVYITMQGDQLGGLYLQLLLFIVPTIGSMIGFWNAAKWGGFQSALGRAVACISAGTFAWAIGMLFWNYYIFVAEVEIPYPSFADAAFILSWPLWTAGVIYLSRATGVRFALRELRGKVLFFLMPVIASIASYYLLIVVARGGIIEFDVTNFWKIFFDLFYPIGSAVIFTITLTFFSLTSTYLGGRYRTPILLLLAAFLVNFIADVMFSYTTTNETYFNGHFVDLLFVTGMYLFALSLSLMAPRTIERRVEKNAANITQ